MSFLQLLNFVFDRQVYRNDAECRKISYDNEIILKSISEVGELETNLDQIKYSNWSNDGKFMSIVADYGYYDIIDVLKRKSIYFQQLTNGLRYVHDLKFLMKCNNSKVILSDNESIRIFDVQYPYYRSRFVSELIYGYNKITTNPHDSNMIFLQFSQNRFSNFDIRQQYNLNARYYENYTNFIYPVHHIDICPTRPYELAICYSFQSIHFYDTRMLTFGQINTTPSKGIVGSIEPFYDFIRANIIAFEYNQNGREIIVTEKSGYTKILSCDPAESINFSSVSTEKNKYHSRTFYSNIDVSDDNPNNQQFIEYKYLKHLNEIIEKTKNFRFTRTGWMYFPITKYNYNISDLHLFRPNYEERINKEYCDQINANKSILWGDNYVILSNRDHYEFKFYDRINQRIFSTIYDPGSFMNISQLSKAPNLPLISVIYGSKSIKLFSSFSLDMIIS